MPVLPHVFNLNTMHVFCSEKKNNLRRGRGTWLKQQWAKDLSQSVCVQAIGGLSLGDLSQVCKEVLQGETMVERDCGGILKDQAYLSLMATSYSSIWKSVSNNHKADLLIKAMGKMGLYMCTTT